MVSNTYKTTIITLYSIFSLALLVIAIINPIFIIFFIAAFILFLIFARFITGKFTLKHYVMILFPCIILSPIVNVPGFPIDIRLDDLWMAFGAVLLITSMIKKKNLTFYLPSYAKVFLIFIAWIAVTISLSTFKEPYYYSIRDWTEVYKNGKLFIYLLIAVNLFIRKDNLKSIVNVVLLSLLGSAIFGIFQYLNLLNINSWLTPLYIFESNIYNLEMNSRVVGTFGNPNIFGFALLIGIALSLAELFKTFKFKYAVSLFAFFIALTMTQSRTATVTGVALVLIMSIMILWRTRKKIKTFILISVIPVLGVIALQYAPVQFFGRISRLNEFSTDARWGMWNNIYQTRTKDNLLFGTGPTSGIRFTFDNEWLMFLTLYGVVGVVLFITMFGFIYYKLGKVDSNHLNFYNIAVRGLIIVFAACMFMSDLFSLLQLMPIFMLLIGLVLNKSVNSNLEQNQM